LNAQARGGQDEDLFGIGSAGGTTRGSGRQPVRRGLEDAGGFGPFDGKTMMVVDDDQAHGTTMKYKMAKQP